MIDPKTVQSYIEDGMDCEYIHVVGDGHHFEAVIVSTEFEGKNRVQQHQTVYRTLGDRMGGEVHALSMKTFTPERWQDVKSIYLK